MSKRNTRSAKAARRRDREHRKTLMGALSEFGHLDLPRDITAELDTLAQSGQLPEGFTIGYGDTWGKLPPGAVKAARGTFPGGWQPGWYWRCGQPCAGGETIGSPELTTVIGACTGS